MGVPVRAAPCPMPLLLHTRRPLPSHQLFREEVRKELAAVRALAADAQQQANARAADVEVGQAGHCIVSGGCWRLGRPPCSVPVPLQHTETFGTHIHPPFTRLPTYIGHRPPRH